MGKTPRVIFHPKRIAEGDWRLTFPEPRFVTSQD